MTESPFVINVTTQDFARIVLEGSRQRAVLVDFWANWCAPCRALGPILDKLAKEWDGKLLVAKVDTDKEKNLAAQLGIRSLPTVRLFKDGRSIDEFMGALPESEVRTFLNRHVPKASDHLSQQAEMLIAQGHFSQALEVAERMRAADPNNISTLLTFARIKFSLGDHVAAIQVLDALPLQEHNNIEAKALRAKIMFAQIASQALPKSVLEMRLSAAPNDSEARYQLATLLVTQGNYQAALDELLTLLRKDRSYGDDAARKRILQIFDILGGEGDLVSRYRAKLTNALF